MPCPLSPAPPRCRAGARVHFVYNGFGAHNGFAVPPSRSPLEGTDYECALAFSLPSASELPPGAKLPHAFFADERLHLGPRLERVGFVSTPLGPDAYDAAARGVTSWSNVPEYALGRYHRDPARRTWGVGPRPEEPGGWAMP